MVGMPAFPVGKNQHAWALIAKHLRDLQPIVPGVLDPAIGNIERLTPRHFQYPSGVGCFPGAVFHSAARSHLTLRQVEDAGAVSSFGHLEQSSSTGLFNVVAMGGQGQDVDWHRWS